MAGITSRFHHQRQAGKVVSIQRLRRQEQVLAGDKDVLYLHAWIDIHLRLPNGQVDKPQFHHPPAQQIQSLCGGTVCNVELYVGMQEIEPTKIGLQKEAAESIAGTDSQPPLRTAFHFCYLTFRVGHDAEGIFQMICQRFSFGCMREI